MSILQLLESRESLLVSSNEFRRRVSNREAAIMEKETHPNSHASRRERWANTGGKWGSFMGLVSPEITRLVTRDKWAARGGGISGRLAAAAGGQVLGRALGKAAYAGKNLAVKGIRKVRGWLKKRSDAKALQKTGAN